MIIKDHDSCPELAGNTTRFEETISPMLQQLKDYAHTVPHDTQHFETDWQDALIDLWQRLHECPAGKEHEWAQLHILSRFRNSYTARWRKTLPSKCCDIKEDELGSSEDFPSEICFSSELDRLENEVSCVQTAKIVHYLRKLPDLDRTIVLMHLDDFTYSEIAHALKLTKSAVIYRFRQTMLTLKAIAQ